MDDPDQAALALCHRREVCTSDCGLDPRAGAGAGTSVRADGRAHALRETARFTQVRALESVPLWLLGLLLFAFFTAVMLGTRAIVGRGRDEEGREQIAADASRMITGLAATFALFVGLSITVTWGAVSTGQVAVEQQASAIRNMNWAINNIPDKVEGAQLRQKLTAYAVAAGYDDQPYLEKGQTRDLPSAVPLDHFEDALHIYAFGPKAQPSSVSSLVTAATAIGTSSSTVSAVAQRGLPTVVSVLLWLSGILVVVVMGIASLDSRHPALMLVWCAIPALSLTVVVALSTPFGAHGAGVNLAPVKTVADELVAAGG